jgi:hypothetical protein
MPSFSGQNIFLTGEIADVSSASSVRIPITDDMEGEVIMIATVLGGAITGAPAVITVSKNNASMGTISITETASGEGDIDTLVPLTTDPDRFLVAGDWLELTTSGASTNAVPVGFSVTINR